MSQIGINEVFPVPVGRLTVLGGLPSAICLKARSCQGKGLFSVSAQNTSAKFIKVSPHATKSDCRVLVMKFERFLPSSSGSFRKVFFGNKKTPLLLWDAGCRNQSGLLMDMRLTTNNQLFYYKLQNHLNTRNDFAYMPLDGDQKGAFDEVACARKRTITIEGYK
jgi:hypothetical protein